MQGTEQVIDELAADKAATEAAAATPAAPAADAGAMAPAERAQFDMAAIDTRPWDERYREGVDRVQALNVQLHAVRGKVLGANQAVVEAEQSMALAQETKAAASQDVADTRDETILTLKNATRPHRRTHCDARRHLGPYRSGQVVIPGQLAGEAV